MDQSSPLGARALVPNPALKPLAFLIGEWETRGTHPQLPGKTLPGRTSFAWHEGGAFVIMHTHVDEDGFPDGVAIIGSDDNARTFSMIYFDERGTSRSFSVEVGDQTLTWRRDNPQLAQTNTIKTDGKDGLVSQGRMSQDGGPWGEDLSQTFRRLQRS